MVEQKSIEELSNLYDFLYEKVDNILKETNPCKFTCGKCVEMIERKTSGCCIGCEHLSKNGCTVKALSCKLWLCSSFKWDKKLLLKLKILSILQWKNNLYGFRMSKEQIFERIKHE